MVVPFVRSDHARAGLAKLTLKAIMPERSITSVSKDARMLKEHT